MITVKHQPETHYANCYVIEGTDMDELITECLGRIRAISKAYYAKELRDDLERDGMSTVDRHAGMGNYYTAKLIN